MESGHQRAKDVTVVSDSADGRNPTLPIVATIFAAGDIICNRYRVIRFISRGGMGEVYEVEDEELKARVALKTIVPSRASSSHQISRFRQEIQLARKVTHPNVCRVFDFGRHKQEPHGDVLFLTMELLEGETLGAQLRRHGPMSCEQAQPLVRQMVCGLAAAHHLGIVHRDFKPGNVMLLQPAETVLKVTDFGLATNPESEETLSVSGADVVGTPEYMAPEQFRGRCSTRTDVYALGVTIFQMLTGKLPASHDAPFKDLGADVAKGISQSWQSAITKCLAKNPSERFATVEEFWHGLSGESLTGSFAAKTASSIVTPRRAAYGGAFALLLCAVGLLLAGILPNPFHRLPDQKHIAVLPFRNIGNDASNQAFAEGVAESLTSKLSQLERYQKSFWVVPASDTRTVKSLDEAYRNLDVTLAVTGSVEHTSQGVDLTANIVDPKNHRQLASRSMHVDSANLDDMQQRVWESVADMLDLQISQQVREELAQGGTTQPGAYELYEQGVGYLRRFTQGDTDRAIGLFSKALEKDPQYALAYAGLGNAYANKYVQTKDPKWVELATQNATRAVALNRELLPVRSTLARVYQQTGKLDLALLEYQRVLQQDPAIIDAEDGVGEVYMAQGKYSQAEETYKDLLGRRPAYWEGHNNLGTLYFSTGAFQKAIREFQTVTDLAPDKPVGYYSLGAAYIAAGQNEEAIDVFKRGIAIAPDRNAWTNLGSAYMYAGKYEQATEAMKKATELSPHDHVMWRNLADCYHQVPDKQKEAKEAYEEALRTANAQLNVNPNDTEVLSGIALYYAHLGHSEQAEDYLDRALKISPNDSDTIFTSALVYEIIGRREDALKALDKALKAGFSLVQLDEEPELKGLRRDGRYQHWLQQVKSATKATVSRRPLEDTDELQECGSSWARSNSFAGAIHQCDS